MPSIDGPRATCFAQVRCVTANVLTLYSNRTEQGEFISARHEALMKSFFDQGVHIAGIQETRSRLTGHHDTEHYHVLSAPATPQGHCGIQIWIAKMFAHQDGISAIYEPLTMRIIHQSCSQTDCSPVS